MKFFSLEKHNKKHKKEILKKISNIIDEGVFIGGKEVLEFEKKLSKISKAKYAVALNSGTDALYLSLKALGIGQGNEVITTPFTFIATAESIVKVGAKPVFVDIGEDFNIDVSKIEEKITKNTKAILPVHLFGRLCNMKEILDISKKHNLFIVEDSCQAIGSKTQGDIACFSFYPTKNLSAFGDAGALTTNDKDLYEKILSLRNHGSSKEEKYLYNSFGVNSRMDVVQASILNIKIGNLKEYDKKRTEIARRYNKELKGIKDIILPSVSKCTFHQYTILVNDRPKLLSYFKENDIPYAIYYPEPLHTQKMFNLKGECPVAENISKRVVSLPIYPELSIKDQSKIISAIKKYHGN